ncbi:MULTISPECIES: cysteine desulfurase family protein [unclassified Myxococcus]|jgi:cysteine desulfurase|uniref:cysteine desulfurase family protein n=1 Tax=Myxococcus TaxID=32 RepID=UPI001CBA8C34|nr:MULTISPECIES: cysteine desulfurase family protein [unclassified Myxococcus]MBZ4399264.1 cysteine desulfurase [Myxococcus sp. AS-1-15]MBZ4411529.1 cysteine desulfurase [Myxococcus sp. XM-1-1-1]BDT30446.1 cysteine desulfurase [Myxococcus sp. MH1]
MSPERPLYLDHNATTPVDPEVVDAMLPYLREHFGNPSSGHAYGRRAHAALEEARRKVAALIGARPDEVFFTSGGTEANNLAIRGTAEARADRRHLLTSVIEHPATKLPCDALEWRGWRVTWLPVDAQGRVRVEDAREALDAAGGETALVSLMHSNNETGVLQPVADLAALARRHGASVHTDAAQSVGKVPVDVTALGVDLLTLVGHKLRAPKGVGALYVRQGTPLRAVTLGGGQERGLRPGTENVPYAVGLGVACELAGRRLAQGTQALLALRERLWTGLRDAVPGLALSGQDAERLPNTLNVRFPGVRGGAVLAATPEVAASTGSACHDGGETASPVLRAMGIPEADALGAVRLSLGPDTTQEEVARAVVVLARGWKQVAG